MPLVRILVECHYLRGVVGWRGGHDNLLAASVGGGSLLCKCLATALALYVGGEGVILVEPDDSAHGGHE